MALSLLENKSECKTLGCLLHLQCVCLAMASFRKKYATKREAKGQKG